MPNPTDTPRTGPDPAALPPDEGVLTMSRGPIPLPTILTIFAVAITLALVWKLSFVLLMGFAAVLIAIALRKTANYLVRYLRLTPTAAVFVVLGAVFLAVLLLVLNAGPQISEQMRQLFAAIPRAWAQIVGWLNNSAIGNFILERNADAAGVQLPQGQEGAPPASGGGAAARAAMPSFNGIFGVLRGTVNAVIGSIANLVLILTVSIFLALHPEPYIQGMLRLVPVGSRGQATEIIAELGDKLWSWLAGQSLDMLIVAVLTGGGLWLLDIPLALVLGIIAGLTNAIPFIGPFLSGIPAVLFALTQGPRDGLYVLLLFVAIQQLEGNIIMPLIQRRAAGLPPVMTIFGVIGFGVLFGLPGVLVAAPLMVVAMVLVQRLYIEGVLGDDLPDYIPAKPPGVPAAD